MSTKEYTIESTKILPLKRGPRKLQLYSDIISDLQSKPSGNYIINIPSKKPLSVYVGLAKRLKSMRGMKFKKGEPIENIKLHYLSGQVYIEKL